MIKMNSKERVLTTMNHEEPDRVPIFTSQIDSLDVLKGYDQESAGSLGDLVTILRLARFVPFYSKWIKFLANRRGTFRLSSKRIIKLFQTIGTDLLAMPTCMLPLGKSAGFGMSRPGLNTPKWSNMVDEFGRMFSFWESKDSDLRLMNYVGGIFESETGDLEEVMAKYEKWAPLDPDIKARYYAYEEAVKLAGDKGPYVIPGLTGFMEVSWQSIGFENYARLLFEHPDFIEEVTRKNGEFSKGIIENLVARYDVELLMVWDDQGYKTGTFISPKQYSRLIYPKMKDLVNFCHKNGIKVIHHTCGNINKILDKVVDTGIDGLNPLEPAAFMDPFQVKKDYGDKITIIGNVDPIHLLAKGTPEKVEAYVKRLIKECAPGGGLIVASGHSINPSVSYVNYRAMIETTRKYGTYPINIGE